MSYLIFLQKLEVHLWVGGVTYDDLEPFKHWCHYNDLGAQPEYGGSYEERVDFHFYTREEIQETFKVEKTK